MLDHQRLDVCRVGLEFVAWASGRCRSPEVSDRHARDRLRRASESIPLNIGEGNGRLPSPDRLKSLRLAPGPALESAGIPDVLRVWGARSGEAGLDGNRMLERMVAMLMRMTRENGAMKDEGVEYEYAHDERRQWEPDGPPRAARPRR